jgi:hypothetical protein
MAPAFSKLFGYQPKGIQRDLSMPLPVIPLCPPESKELKKGDYLKMSIKASPEDPDSEGYNMNVRYFSRGTVHEWIEWQKSFAKIEKGQSLNTGPRKFNTIKHLLREEALRAFEAKAKELGGEESIENFKACLQAVSLTVFPQKAIARQKRYMRRAIKKPPTMKIREFVGRLFEMNEELAYFPPMYSEEEILDEDELMDIVEISIPFSWQRQLVIQGFDINEHTLNELVEFCERLEVTEDLFRESWNYGRHKKLGQSSRASQDESKLQAGAKRVAEEKTSEGGSPSKKRSMGRKWCALHEVDTHDTSECKVMLKQAKRLRESWKASPWQRANKRNKPANKTESKEESNLISQTQKKSKNKSKGHKRKAISFDFEDNTKAASVQESYETDDSSSSDEEAQ